MEKSGEKLQVGLTAPPFAMASLLPRLRLAGTRTMSTASADIAIHPQQAVHALSLLSSLSPPGVTHLQARSAAEPQGSEDAQNFWLGAAKLISWSKAPTVAYGSQGDKVS